MSRAYAPDIAALTTALFYGVTVLGEPLTVEGLVDMALILGGAASGSGAVRMHRREPALATPSP